MFHDCRRDSYDLNIAEAFANKLYINCSLHCLANLEDPELVYVWNQSSSCWLSLSLTASRCLKTPGFDSVMERVKRICPTTKELSFLDHTNASMDVMESEEVKEAQEVDVGKDEEPAMSAAAKAKAQHGDEIGIGNPEIPLNQPATDESKYIPLGNISSSYKLGNPVENTDSVENNSNNSNSMIGPAKVDLPPPIDTALNGIEGGIISISALLVDSRIGPDGNGPSNTMSKNDISMAEGRPNMNSGLLKQEEEEEEEEEEERERE